MSGLLSLDLKMHIFLIFFPLRYNAYFKDRIRRSSCYHTLSHNGYVPGYISTISDCYLVILQFVSRHLFRHHHSILNLCIVLNFHESPAHCTDGKALGLTKTEPSFVPQKHLTIFYLSSNQPLSNGHVFVTSTLE